MQRRRAHRPKTASSSPRSDPAAKSDSAAMIAKLCRPGNSNAPLLPLLSVQCPDRYRDALAAADAQRHDAALETISFHRVNQLGGQHRAGGADRMTVGDGAAFHIDDVVGQAELARDYDRDRGEGFI